MAVTEQDRLALRAKLTEILGERETGVLMDCVPPVDYEQLTTKTDLETQRLVLSAEITTLRADMTAGFASMELRMATQMRATVVTHVGSMIGLAAFMAAIT